MLPPLKRIVPGIAAFAASVTASFAHAKCDEWLPTFGGPDGRVDALIVYDNMLVAAGDFAGVAEDDAVRSIAIFNGQMWLGLAGGMAGGGPSIDSRGVRALATFNGELIAGGYFTRAGGQEAHKIARWDGRAWSALGEGVDHFDPNGDPAVLAMIVFNDQLIVAGRFTIAGDVEASHVAGWDGAAWSPIGAGLESPVHALAVFGNRLIAGGEDFIRAWDGKSWSDFGGQPQLNGTVRAMIVHENQLFMGGHFTGPSGGTNHSVILTDGTTWDLVGDDVFDGAAAESFAEVRALVIYNGDLIAAGLFTSPGASIARFDGRTWHPMSNAGVNGANALTIYSGALTAAGEFIDPSSGEIAYVGGYSDCELESPADINGDGQVNIHDLLAVLMAWGTCPDTAAPCSADIAPLAVGDDQVNIADLMLVISMWD